MAVAEAVPSPCWFQRRRRPFQSFGRAPGGDTFRAARTVMCSAPPGRPALILGVVADRGSQQIQSVEVALDFVQYVLAFDFLSAAAEED